MPPHTLEPLGGWRQQPYTHPFCIGQGRLGFVTMAACVTNRLWEISDLVALMEASERD